MKPIVSLENVSKRFNATVALNNVSLELPAVLLSSHQISEVERVADWVAILHRGELKIVEPLEQLKSNVHLVTASLESSECVIAAPRGNVLSESRTGRQMRWIVKDLAADWESDFGNDRGVKRCEMQRPTLEEIFIAMCDDNAVRPAQTNDDIKPETVEALE